MTAEQAFVVEMWCVVNGAALVVLVVLSFAGGWLILEGLDALDRWMRVRQHGGEEVQANEQEPEASDEGVR